MGSVAFMFTLYMGVISIHMYIYMRRICCKEWMDGSFQSHKGIQVTFLWHTMNITVHNRILTFWGSGNM